MFKLAPNVKPDAFVPHIQIFRHVRNGSGGKITSAGGVTAYVEADPSSKWMRVAVAVCDEADQFNSKIGREISFGRFQAGKIFVEGRYEPELSLVQNLQSLLDLNSNREDAKVLAGKIARYTKVVPRELASKDI